LQHCVTKPPKGMSIAMERKDEIIAAATELFAEKGYSATPTSAVAERAGVAEGLIFHYFKNKLGVLTHIFSDFADVYLDGMEKAMDSADDGLNALLATIRFHFKIVSEQLPESTVILRDLPQELITVESESGSIVTEKSLNQFHLTEKCIKRGQKDGSIRDVPADEFAHIIVGMLRGVSRLKFQMPGDFVPPDFCPSVIDFCRQSLSSDNVTE